MFKPDIYAKDVFSINYDKLQSNGVKLLCFDLDNTLDVPDSITTEIRKDINELLDLLEINFEVMIISNNNIKGRVASFADKRGMHYIESAKKPFTKNYRSDHKISSFSNHEIAFIGDKIVTDIVGAKRYNSYGILVDPLYPKNKHWYSIIMKASEKVFCTLIRFKKGKYYEEM